MLSLILFKLTLRDVLADIPHDAGSIAVYALIALFVGLTFLGSRQRSGGDAGSPRTPGGPRD